MKKQLSILFVLLLAMGLLAFQLHVAPTSQPISNSTLEQERQARDASLPHADSIPIEDRGQNSLTDSAFWEQSLSIHQNLPDFLLQLSGSGDIFTTLAILDEATRTIIYQQNFDKDFAISTERFSVELIDMDFDGYLDINLFSGYGGNWKLTYHYILWNPDTNGFVEDPYELGNLGLPVFDGNRQQVRSMQRGSAADHWYYTHQYIDGELVVIEEVAENSIWDYNLDHAAEQQLQQLEPRYDTESTSFLHLVKKQRDPDTKEMDVVVDVYQLYEKDGILISEYTCDSPIWLLLESYK